MRQLFAGLLPRHVLGVPVRPVLVAAVRSAFRAVRGQLPHAEPFFPSCGSPKSKPDVLNASIYKHSGAFADALNVAVFFLIDLILLVPDQLDFQLAAINAAFQKSRHFHLRRMR
jgi:hypothetical protein